MAPSIQTFGELKTSGYQVLPVKAELRRNLIARLKDHQPLFLALGDGLTGHLQDDPRDLQGEGRHEHDGP